VTPYIMVTNLARTIDELKERDIWVVGTDERAELSLYQANIPESVAWVLGAEGEGMRRLTASVRPLVHPDGGSVESSTFRRRRRLPRTAPPAPPSPGAARLPAGGTHTHPSARRDGARHRRCGTRFAAASQNTTGRAQTARDARPPPHVAPGGPGCGRGCFRCAGRSRLRLSGFAALSAGAGCAWRRRVAFAVEGRIALPVPAQLGNWRAFNHLTICALDNMAARTISDMQRLDSMEVNFRMVRMRHVIRRYC
jgi:hypothetical protein